MSFRRIPCGPDRPLPVVVVGAGLMGRAWLAAVEGSPVAELVGVADLDLRAAGEAAASLGRPDLPTGVDPIALASETGAEALVDVTVPEAHHPVTSAALLAGLPVLGEKPVADTVARALSLTATSEVTGELFMVSQSRRWNADLFLLREMVRVLGPVGTLATEFFKAPHFGGFRERMAHPLLVDMAIHAFDSARFLLGADPVSAYCEAFNPSWSWYDGDASAVAVFEMEGGRRFAYTGSWCSPGAETSWEGSWRVSGERGSALWDGTEAPRLHADVEPAAPVGLPAEGISGSLAVFVEALRTGVAPMGEVHENVMSLAMVAAAVHSAETGRRVLVDEVLERARAEAVRDETLPDVRRALAGWASVREALAAGSTPLLPDWAP